MDDKVTTVFCTVFMEGVHHWPGCPFDEVAYLRDPHRHIFHIKCYKQVFHDDRDVEFIMLKHRVQEFLRDQFRPEHGVAIMGATSCEMLARMLIDKFDLTQCEVNEDGENGAIMYAGVGQL